MEANKLWIGSFHKKQWPELKKRTRSEQDLEKLMALLVEIDELLFTPDMKVRVKNDAGFNALADSQSVVQASKESGS